jgi:hypothetical protein
MQPAQEDAMSDNQLWAALDSQNERLVEACHPLLRAIEPDGRGPRRRWRPRATRQPVRQRHADRGGTRSQA